MKKKKKKKKKEQKWRTLQQPQPTTTHTSSHQERGTQVFTEASNVPYRVLLLLFRGQNSLKEAILRLFAPIHTPSSLSLLFAVSSTTACTVQHPGGVKTYNSLYSVHAIWRNNSLYNTTQYNTIQQPVQAREACEVSVWVRAVCQLARWLVAPHTLASSCSPLCSSHYDYTHSLTHSLTHSVLLLSPAPPTHERTHS